MIILFPLRYTAINYLHGRRYSKIDSRLHFSRTKTVIYAYRGCCWRSFMIVGIVFLRQLSSTKRSQTWFSSLAGGIPASCLGGSLILRKKSGEVKSPYVVESISWSAALFVRFRIFDRLDYTDGDDSLVKCRMFLCFLFCYGDSDRWSILFLCLVDLILRLTEDSKREMANFTLLAPSDCWSFLS